MRHVWPRPSRLVIVLVALAVALGSFWAPWLGVEHGECGWTCYVPLTPKTADLTSETLGGPAGRFVAPAGVGLTIASVLLALASVVMVGRRLSRRMALPAVAATLLAAAGAVVLSVVSLIKTLDHDLVVFDRSLPDTSAASGTIGPGIFMTAASAFAAAGVAVAIARRKASSENDPART